MLDVRRLRFLVELSRYGTIAAVSEALHMSPSGISHQLSVLEREAGTALLERVGRGVRLTDAGQRLAVRGADILASLEHAQTELHGDGESPTGTCRVAAFGSAARALVPAILGCQRRNPSLRVELVESEPEVAVPALLSGGFDIVVSEEYPGLTPPLPRHVHRETLAQDPLEIVVSTQLLEGRDVVQAGASLAWALEPVGAASRAWATQHCSTLGFSPTVQYESWDLGLLLHLVEQGAAASMLPSLVLRGASPLDGDLHRAETGQCRTLVVLTRQARRDVPSIQVLSSAFRDAFGSMRQQD